MNDETALSEGKCTFGEHAEFLQSEWKLSVKETVAQIMDNVKLPSAELATPGEPPKPALFDRAMTFYESLRVQWRNWWNRDTANAYKTLTKAMVDDPQFAASWQANIAMPMFDAAKGKLTHEEANEIADKLMRHLFDYEKKPQTPVV